MSPGAGRTFPAAPRGVSLETGHIQSSFRDTIPREVGAPTESGQSFGV